MALEVHSAPSSYGTSRLSLRAWRISLRLARISCQNRNAEPTIPGTAAAQPRRSMAGSSWRPGAAQAMTTKTATSAVQAHSTALAAPTARLTSGPPSFSARDSPVPPLHAVQHLLSLGGVLLELGGGGTNEAGYHGLALHVLQDGEAGPIFHPKRDRVGLTHPEEVHAARSALAEVVLRQVPHGQVEARAFDASHLDPIGSGCSQVRMPHEPADHVLWGLHHGSLGILGGLVDVDLADVGEAQPPRLVSPREQQGVGRLRRFVRPALADPKGERGLELLGAVGAGAQLLPLLRQGTGRRLLDGRPAGDRREDAEGQHHPQPKGVLRYRPEHLPRPLLLPPYLSNYGSKILPGTQHGHGVRRITRDGVPGALAF